MKTAPNTTATQMRDLMLTCVFLIMPAQYTQIGEGGGGADNSTINIAEERRESLERPCK